MTVLTVLCIVVLSVWFLIALLSQLQVSAVAPLKAHDIFSLIPNWSFFAPRPGTSDYHLVYRDQRADGECSAWREIPLASRRTMWGALWNPQKRATKTLSDVVRVLITMAQNKVVSDFSLTMPYLSLLNYISALPRTTPGLRTQFMILKSEGFFDKEDPVFLFMSNMHNLQPGGAAPVQPR